MKLASSAVRLCGPSDRRTSARSLTRTGLGAQLVRGRSVATDLHMRSKAHPTLLLALALGPGPSTHVVAQDSPTSHYSLWEPQLSDVTYLRLDVDQLTLVRPLSSQAPTFAPDTRETPYPDLSAPCS